MFYFITCLFCFTAHLSSEFWKLWNKFGWPKLLLRTYCHLYCSILLTRHARLRSRLPCYPVEIYLHRLNIFHPTLFVVYKGQMTQGLWYDIWVEKQSLFLYSCGYNSVFDAWTCSPKLGLKFAQIILWCRRKSNHKLLTFF